MARQPPECLAGKIAYVCGHILGQIGRDAFLSGLHTLAAFGTAHVFVGIREDLATFHRFFEYRCLVFVAVTEDRTIDFLKIIDHVLYDDAPGVARGIGDLVI